MPSPMQLQTLLVKLVADSSKWDKGFSKAEGAISRLTHKASRLGTALTVGVTTPLAAMGAASVKAFSDFEDAMTKSTAIMGDLSDATREAMDVQAKELAQRGVQSATQLAEAYFYLASAGLNAEQAMAALPITQAFATAGAFDMARATDLVTDAQSALGMTVKDTQQNMENMARVSDVLVKANTLANATVEQFSISLTSKAGSALKIFNKSVEEGVAVLAAMADQGVKAELAGNQLDRFIRLLASSSLNAAENHKKLGFQVFDATGKMRNMADIVENLEGILGGLSDQQKVATLEMLGFEARVQQAVLPLIGLSDKIRGYEEALNSAKGTTQEVADKQLKSFASQVKMLRNQLNVLAIEIGEQLVPHVQALLEHVKGALEWWKSLDSETQKLIITIAMWTAVLGPALLILSKLTMAVVVLTKALVAVKTAMMATAAGSATLKLGLVALTGYIAFKLTSALTGATRAYRQFNEAQKEAKRLAGDVQEGMDRRHGQRIQEIQAIQDQAQRQEALNSAIERAKKEYEGSRQNLQNTRRELQQYNTTWNNMVGSKQLERMNNELEIAEQATAAAKRRLQELEDVQFTESLTPSVDLQAIEDALAGTGPDIGGEFEGKFEDMMKAYEDTMKDMTSQDADEFLKTYKRNMKELLEEPEKKKDKAVKAMDAVSGATLKTSRAMKELDDAGVGAFDAVALHSKEAVMRLEEHRRLMRDTGLQGELPAVLAGRGATTALGTTGTSTVALSGQQQSESMGGHEQTVERLLQDIANNTARPPFDNALQLQLANFSRG